MVDLSTTRPAPARRADHPSTTRAPGAATEPLQGPFSVGLDIGGTKVFGILLGPDGTVHNSVRLPTARGREGVVRSAAQAVRDVAGQVGVDPARLTGVGVGVPGLVDPAGGAVRHAVNLGIEGEPLPLAALLSAELDGVPVAVDNDLNVAALGASHALATGLPTGASAAARAGADPDEAGDLAFLALGTGLAAGIVLGGELRRGVSGAAGEIGHIPVDPDGRVCACGQRGCLETVASGTALETLWPARTGRPAPVELFEAAAAGEPDAVRVKNVFTGAVASAVRLLVLTVDVRHVVLGGGVSLLGEPLLAAVRDALDEQSRPSPFLASLELSRRVSLAPVDMPVAAVGAALVGRRKES